MKKSRIGFRFLFCIAILLSAGIGYFCGRRAGGRFVKYSVGGSDNVFPKEDVLYNMETDLFLEISKLIAQEKYDELDGYMEKQMSVAREKAITRAKHVDKEQAAEIMRTIKMTERD